ncbi:DUF305 domain-containing protein [Cupriavidus gilardii]|nr:MULTISPECIES: DUF305 domain-containing protein [Cupriavidus]KAA0178769.1 DUF305 domain-containing protein [Cupriavidus gilardii]MBO4120646.1 DUF305 domain-containing protein [Cupriavidus gilardii]MCA7082510.1 DUF305 domain-containing protein [Cupriavidus sp. DB3]MCT9119140.1 DUF305 domain-containing protein [Cupriavidus gilardii]MCT9124974.1 DUF305 domain-containing protein [Cupriavidus gilardii]
MRTLAGKVLATIAAASATLVVGLPSVSAQHADGHHGHTMGGGGGDQDMHRSMAPGMNNMMSMQSTGDIDRDFANMMKMHHQMAIDMARTEAEKGKSPEMKRMADDIIKESQRDIRKIDQWLEQRK